MNKQTDDIDVIAMEYIHNRIENNRTKISDKTLALLKDFLEYALETDMVRLSDE